jgi:hypothetical protein
VLRSRRQAHVRGALPGWRNRTQVRRPLPEPDYLLLQSVALAVMPSVQPSLCTAERLTLTRPVERLRLPLSCA